MLCNSTSCWYSVSVKPFLVNKVPVVVIFYSMIPQYRSLKNLGNLNLSHLAIATAYHLFALASSLLVKRSTTTCKMSVIAFFFTDDLSMTPCRCPPRHHKSDQEAADKQAWSLLRARASVLHARSLLA